MRNAHSYKWASERVKNVLGLAFAVPAKEGEDEAPAESKMQGGQKVDPHLMRSWSRTE